jgi:hypothetical protein
MIEEFADNALEDCMGALRIIGFIGYLLVGLLQIAATIEGLNSWVGIPTILAVPIALFLGYLPVIGSVVGMVGAIQFWGWQWYWAALLFFWPIVLLIVVGGFGALFEAVRRR